MRSKKCVQSSVKSPLNHTQTPKTGLSTDCPSTNGHYILFNPNKKHSRFSSEVHGRGRRIRTLNKGFGDRRKPQDVVFWNHICTRCGNEIAMGLVPEEKFIVKVGFALCTTMSAIFSAPSMETKTHRKGGNDDGNHWSNYDWHWSNAPGSVGEGKVRDWGRFTTASFFLPPHILI